MTAPTQKLPIPEPTRHPPSKWPWRTMKVGEMFFSPNHETNTMTTLAWSTGKKLGRKFTTRLVWMNEHGLCKETDRGAVQGIGVWRHK